MYPYQYNYQQSQIIKVNGENGARAFQMMPNSSVLLLDEREPLVYLVQTDGAGYKSMMAYKIVPVQVEQSSGIKDIDMHLHSLEAKLDRMEEWMNAQSNTTTDKRSE